MRAVFVPHVVERLAGDRALRLVWANAVGGLTFEVGEGDGRFFIKWAPPMQDRERDTRLAAEATRLRWAGRFTPVPEVIDQGRDETGSWLVTTPVPGENAVSEKWKADPATAVRAVGEGLRALHEALPVATCPFSWSSERRVARAHRRAKAGQIDPSEWDDIHQSLDMDTALGRAARIPPGDELVVCHGDACAPNTILNDDGRWAGHVDLGTLGVADRWADLAVATWSTQWNYGPGWEGPLLDAYGIQADPDRIRYYRLLWDLAS